MPKRILMIAFHFPPVQGSSGVHRTLQFSRFLAEDHGWEPTILTVHPRAYEAQSDDQLSDIAPGVEVIRAGAFDTKRHFSLVGRYPRALALPDRWMSWKPFAVRAAVRAHRRSPFDVVWSTYPIATAHAIGAEVAQRTGVPWVADFRDSMTEPGYPSDPRQRESYFAIERRAAKESCRAVFTTPGARAMYAIRYPDVPDSRWAVIENGYDERSFQAAEQDGSGPSKNGPLLLVHAGLLYRSERDPRAFYDALRTLKQEGAIDASGLRVHLRASGDEAYHASEIAARGINDIVHLLPPLPYRDALNEMMTANGLLLFQASNCNHQIPAKAYEYVRARRPILALTDPAGDTAALLATSGAATVAPLDCSATIANELRRFLDELASGRVRAAPDDFVLAKSRRARARELAELLRAIDPTSARPGG